VTRTTVEENDDTGIRLGRLMFRRLEQPRQSETKQPGAADLQDFPPRNAWPRARG
jgi:hypothetical protein